MGLTAGTVSTTALPVAGSVRVTASTAPVTGSTRNKGYGHLSERRKVFGDRVAQSQSPFLAQNQCSKRNDRLRHRREVENRVGGHRHVVGLVAIAERPEVGELALAGDGDDRSRNASAVDILLHGVRDSLKTFGGQTDGFRASTRQRSLGGR